MNRKELEEWGQKWVPTFNELSEKYNTVYYTQSPLDHIEDDVEVMLIGINPGGNGAGVTYVTPEEFLKGNPAWKERFKDGRNVWRYTNGVRFYLGYDSRRHDDTIDDDSRVVWTNLSPFASENGFSELKPELRDAGIESTAELISVLRPQQIILHSANAFNLLDKYSGYSAELQLEHIKVFDNLPLEIGRISFQTETGQTVTIPTYQVKHPSGKWPVSHCFTSIFLYLLRLSDVYENGKPAKPLAQVRKDLRHEVKLWQSCIEVKD
ncbi:MAG: uracil-DNA glycosylase family protein [Prevotellaceae bacterium]|nr:uracil-DNA glycosylase family protein [Prevotellaceae bacterium]